MSRSEIVSKGLRNLVKAKVLSTEEANNYWDSFAKGGTENQNAILNLVDGLVRKDIEKQLSILYKENKKQIDQERAANDGALYQHFYGSTAKMDGTNGEMPCHMKVVHLSEDQSDTFREIYSSQPDKVTTFLRSILNENEAPKEKRELSLGEKIIRVDFANVNEPKTTFNIKRLGAELINKICDTKVNVTDSNLANYYNISQSKAIENIKAAVMIAVDLATA